MSDGWKISTQVAMNQSLYCPMLQGVCQRINTLLHVTAISQLHSVISLDCVGVVLVQSIGMFCGCLGTPGFFSLHIQPTISRIA